MSRQVRKHCDDGLSASKPRSLLHMCVCKIETLQLAPNSRTLRASVPSGFIQSLYLCWSKFPHKPPTLLLYMRGRVISVETKHEEKKKPLDAAFEVNWKSIILLNKTKQGYLRRRIYQTSPRGRSRTSGRCEMNVCRFSARQMVKREVRQSFHLPKRGQRS